jgi:hypothetical protein
MPIMLIAGVFFIASIAIVVFNESLTSAAAGTPFEFLAEWSGYIAGGLMALAAERTWRALDLGTALSRARRRNDPGPG